MENNSTNRVKAITNTSFIGLFANVFLAILKAIVGFFANSVAVILDAVNNFSDALSSIITILGIKLSKKKPDEKHPYGYGRVEYFSSIVIGVLILSTGVTSLIESVKKIITPEETTASYVTIIILSAAVIVKVLLGLFTKKQGEKYNSDALKASGTESLFDSIVSLLTLVSIAVSVLFQINIDGFVGCVVSLFIVKAGAEVLLEAVGNIMGNRPDSEITMGIKATIREIDGILGTYDLVLHYYGPDAAFGSVHIAVDSKMDANKIYELTNKVNQIVVQKYHVFLTVGIYAIDQSKKAETDKIEEIVSRFEGTLGTHGYYIDEKAKRLSFDVAIDFSVKDRNRLCEEIKTELSKIFQGYTITINFDAYFSD